METIFFSLGMIVCSVFSYFNRRNNIKFSNSKKKIDFILYLKEDTLQIDAVKSEKSFSYPYLFHHIDPIVKKRIINRARDISLNEEYMFFEDNPQNETAVLLDQIFLQSIINSHHKGIFKPCIKVINERSKETTKYVMCLLSDFCHFKM